MAGPVTRRSSFRPIAKGYDFDRLRAILNNSEMQRENSAAYQVINTLIDGTQFHQKYIDAQLRAITQVLVENGLINLTINGNITANNFSGSSSGVNSGDLILSGALDYLTLEEQILTLGFIDLLTDVENRLPYANLEDATAASRLLGRGSASGAGDWQEVTLGSNLTMTGTVLDAVGGATTEFTSTDTGTIDDLDFDNANLIRMNNASDATITGLLAGTPGQVVTIVSIGAGNVYLADNDGGSSADNQLINLVTSQNTPLATASGKATYIYDDTTNRWRLIFHEQGAAISQPYDAADFTASGTMTWTVASGDVGIYQYFLRGRQLYFTIQFDTTSITAPLSNQCRFVIPGDFTTGAAAQGFCFIIDNGTRSIGRWFIGTSTELYIEKVPLANYAGSTNNTYFAAQGFLEVI